MIVKVCGVTNLADAEVAIQAGANALGFNFYPPSPRCVDVVTSRPPPPAPLSTGCPAESSRQASS